jgi:osmotically inducible lipoprotein OsmB
MPGATPSNRFRFCYKHNTFIHSLTYAYGLLSYDGFTVTDEQKTMKTTSKANTRVIGACLALAVLAGAAQTEANAMGRRETRNTAIGAGVGALGGYLVSGGDTLGTVGGAVAGGVIGNLVTGRSHHDEHHDYRGERHYRDAGYRHGHYRD